MAPEVQAVAAKASPDEPAGQNDAAPEALEAVVAPVETEKIAPIAAAPVPAPAVRRPQGDQSKIKRSGYPVPMPIDKFKALDIAFGKKVNWAKIYGAVSKTVRPAEYKDLEVVVPLVLGIRICDGVMTIKMKDSGELNRCAEDIEALAKMLKIPEKDLRYARAMRDAATQADWALVFENLGVLAHLVKQQLEKTDHRTATFVMVGAWMQGVRYVGRAVLELGESGGVDGEHPSYFMREPDLVKTLLEEVNAVTVSTPRQKAILDTAKARLAAMHRTVASIVIDPKKGRLTPAGLKELLEAADAITGKSIESKN